MPTGSMRGSSSTRAADAIIVPTSALFRSEGGWAVYVVADSHAQRRTIDIGPRSGLAAVVERGLDPGAQVIVYPGDMVRDGVRVRSRRRPRTRQGGERDRADADAVDAVPWTPYLWTPVRLSR